MKKSIIACALATTSSLSFADSIDLQPGSGYVSSTKSIAPSICYAMDPGTIEGPEGLMSPGERFDRLIRSVSYDDRPESSKFYPKAEVAFMSALSENSPASDGYGYGYGAYLLTYRKQIFHAHYGLDHALNETGKQFYNADPKQQEIFDKNCGDYVFTAYPEGIFFIAGLRVHFSNAQQAETYRVKSLSTNDNLLSRINSIKTLTENYSLSGTVTIQAYQEGGDPSQLNSILTANDEGFYDLSCDLRDLEPCINATNAMYDYFGNVLPAQTNFNSNIGIVPLNSLPGLRGRIPKIYLGL